MQGTKIKGGYSLFEEVAPFDFPPSRGDGVCSALRCMDSAALSATARQRGILSFRREYPPLDPPRERRGAFPLDPAHWQPLARRAARPAECKCGVHGFAMSLLRVGTGINRALLRGARVTVVWRRTACASAALLRSPPMGGLRHRCARRWEVPVVMKNDRVSGRFIVCPCGREDNPRKYRRNRPV